MEKTIQVGMMPGKLDNYAVAIGTSIAKVLEIAQLDSTGYEVKVNGMTVTDLQNTVVQETTNLVLLVKQVKGN